jgi:hypothetical protein
MSALSRWRLMADFDLLTEPAKSLKILQCHEARRPDFRDELGQRDNAR